MERPGEDAGARRAASWTGDPDFVGLLQVSFGDLYASSWTAMQDIIRTQAGMLGFEVVRETPPPDFLFVDNVPVPR